MARDSEVCTVSTTAGDLHTSLRPQDCFFVCLIAPTLIDVQRAVPSQLIHFDSQRLRAARVPASSLMLRLMMLLLVSRWKGGLPKKAQSSQVRRASAHLPRSKDTRHPAVEYLKKSTTELRGIGPKSAQQLESLGIHNIASLLLHIPRDVLVRRSAMVANAEVGSVQTFVLHVVKVDEIPSARGKIFLTYCRDAEGTPIKILHFAFVPFISVLKKYFFLKRPVLVSGKVSLDTRYGGLMISHPDIVVEATDGSYAIVPAVEPVYSLVDGMSSSRFNSIVNAALDGLQEYFRDWLPASVLSERSWPTIVTALRTVHNPKSPECIQPTSAAMQRLAHDELVSFFIDEVARDSGKDFSVVWDDSLTTKFIGRLPFELTASQISAIQDIKSDLRAPVRMERLLQGDVGSGKTVVAFVALLTAIEGRRQGGEVYRAAHWLR